MFQPSSDTCLPEPLSQLCVKICSVRLPSSSKIVDICVIMEIDNKYPYRTEIIRKNGKTNTTNRIMLINETFDALVTINSTISFKIHAPTRRFGNSNIGQIEFNLKSIIDNYYLKEQNNYSDDTSPSYHVQLPFENSNALLNSSRLNDNNHNSNDNNHSSGMIEVVFYGSIFMERQNETMQTLPELVNIFW